MSPGESTGPPVSDAGSNDTIPIPASDTSLTDAPTSIEPSATEHITLTMEGWNLAAAGQYSESIFPLFTATHPDVDLAYLASEASAYDELLTNRLEGGTAGDLITCRSFDRSLKLYEAGHLVDVTDLESEVLPDESYRAWSTDDGSERFCVPVSSVMQGILYNDDIMTELGLEIPTTQAEFVDTLQAVQDDGRYFPLAIGVADEWRIGNLGINILGPSYWGADEGRQKLTTGQARFTDQGFVDLFSALGEWGRYLPEASDFVDSAGARDLFMQGQALFYPAGSWEFGGMLDADIPIKALRPIRRDAQSPCVVVDHPDVGIGVNPASPNVDAALEFVEWVGTSEFGDTRALVQPGQFSMQVPAVATKDELSQEFQTWRQECDTSLRLTSQVLGRGPDNIERFMWDLVSDVVAGRTTAEQAAQQLDDELYSWYVPAGQ